MHRDADRDGEEPQPGIAALLSQLGVDATDFARAEVRHLQAQTEERISIAVPALIMIAASGVLLLAVIVTIMVGAILVLIPVTGLVLAIVIIVFAATIVAFLLYRAGRGRMARVFRKLEG
jgi:uncharacterized membrane protein